MSGEDFLALLTCGLAAWRLASMISTEHGPWHLFDRLRLFAGLRPMAEAEGFWAELLDCVWCAGFWCAALMLLLWWAGLVIVPVLFAAGAVVVMVERFVRP